MDKLAIVILNFNGRHFLEKFLPGINACSNAFPVYIADNASTDGSAQWLEKSFPATRTISFPKNLGYAGGYNSALSQIEAEYFILLNSDVEVTPGWIEPMLDFMEGHADFAACQPKMLSFNHKEYFEYAGAAGGYIDRYGYPFCRGRIFTTLEKDENQYSDQAEIFWASGACMIIRSSVFYKAGGFDTDFFAHMEEIDLCWRLKKAGWKIGYVGSSHVYHVGGGTLSSGNPFKTCLNFRNNLAMLIKNLDKEEILIILAARFVLDLLAALKFLIFDSPRNAWAVLKGIFHTYTRFGVHRNKRLDASDSYPNKKIKGIYRKSIVAAYYFRKKRKFPQLNVQ